MNSSLKFFHKASKFNIPKFKEYYQTKETDKTETEKDDVVKEDSDTKEWWDF
jgi:hypothetical protein